MLDEKTTIQNIDDDLVCAAVAFMFLFACIIGIVAELGLGPYVLAAAFGAWLQKTFA